MTQEGFKDNVQIDENGCWIWQRAIRGKSGYGCLRVKGKLYDAHRFSFILFKGEVPEKHLVCHTCDVRKCCNPDHLFAGTYSDNYWDAVKKGRIILPQPKDPATLKPCPSVAAYKRGCRCSECRELNNEEKRIWRARQKEQPIRPERV
jgi:hypothetical protein